MATQKQINEERKQLFELLLEKTNLTKKDIVEDAISTFIAKRLDMITPSERKKFKSLVF